MKILAVGGGSGGHVTPVVAVLREIRQTHPKAEIRFWCDSKFAASASEIMGHFDSKIPVYPIVAGKLRRYHHLSIIRQLLWPSLVLSNIRDSFLVIAGFFQSLFKLIVWRPNVVFAKGGYVCLPVGIAARILRISLVIHDSDAYPGLTNRILGRFATSIATGAPLKYYSYPAKKSRYVGIPIAPEFFEFFSINQRQAAKKQWGIDPNRPLVVVTGGGQGASNINDAVALATDNLLKLGSLVLICGAEQYDALRSITPIKNNNFKLYPFISKDMASLLGAADVVITRAGATTILELAALEKPTILIPNGKLTGGHQLKNAAVYLKQDAVIVIDESKMIDNPQILASTAQELLSNHVKTAIMAKKFASFARPNAARDVAEMVMSSAK